MFTSYVNEKYPHSNRTYSRPFHSYFNRYRTEAENVESAFWDNVFYLGWELMGGEENRCCDLYFSDKVDRDEAFKNKQAIIDNIQNYRLLSFPTADNAMLEIGKELQKDTNDEIDITALKENLEVVWGYKPLLDPRLVHAERIFTHIAESKVENLHSYKTGVNPKERVTASLTWMNKDENAEKIAKMFLYSRLAQHFGETNKFVPLFVNKVHHDIHHTTDGVLDDYDIAFNQLYVVEHLVEDPYGYYRSVLPKPSGLVEKFKNLKENLTYNPQKAAEQHITEPEDLKNTAEKMISDYWLLYTGEWAQNKLKELDRSDWDGTPKKYTMQALRL